ncbi:MAG: hypothetical protein EAX90_10080 [Candidatus Heimdallarchaeota archaeon]|nr:hypothetical protein [Candidatus Heimdallarchaeota archaeon]
MKKKSYFIIFLILNFIFTMNFVRADYQVTSGNIFHYDVILNELTFTNGDTEYYGNGFSIDGHHLEQGYTCTVIVDTVDTSSVDSTIFGGGYSEQFTCWWSLDSYDFALLISNHLHTFLNLIINPSFIVNGPRLFFYPFIDTLYAYPFFEQFVYQTNFHLTNALSYYTEPTFECVSDDSGDIYYFESYFTGSIIEIVDPPTQDIDFKVQLKFAYEKTTGILKGLHYLAQGEGEIYSQSSSYTCETLIEMQDYNLPRFELGGFSFDIAEDWWIIAAAGGGGLFLIVIIIVVVVSVKKKKKKTTKKKSTKKRK